MPEPTAPQVRVLEPMDRISEVLFGLIMVLTYTGSLSVATADRTQTRTMLIGALGCNLAWGIIDAGMYLMARLHERRRHVMLLRALRDAADADAARRVVAAVLPSAVTEVLSPEQLERLRQQSRRTPEPGGRLSLIGADGRGALGVFLLVFLTTLPVAVPFILIGDTKLALRLSNAVAIVMLFLCGYAFGRHAGMRPWATGIAMVAVGLVLVALTISLGG
jgi:VIT1/CCC1 family predicted Fe2+/Mn2+ transporter